MTTLSTPTRKPVPRAWIILALAALSWPVLGLICVFIATLVLHLPGIG